MKVLEIKDIFNHVISVISFMENCFMILLRGIKIRVKGGLFGFLFQRLILSGESTKH